MRVQLHTCLFRLMACLTCCQNPSEAATSSLQAKQRCLQRYDALWIVHTFSLRWRYLQHRRETRQRVYDQARLYPSHSSDPNPTPGEAHAQCCNCFAV